MGGDSTWAGNNYLTGVIANASVYTSVLAPARVAAHYEAAPQDPIPNQEPTAEFSWESTGLDVDFDGSASLDPDGTIVSYAWDFGDGNVATGPTPATHTYAVAGTYTVALTVTDDVGATDTVTNEVTVSAANVSPTAEFSWESTGLDVDFDGSASLDPDGTIVSYAWDFGDGNVATGPTPATHTYAVAGTYTVALTVTDDVGATDTVTNEVTVSAANVVPTAEFSWESTDLDVDFDGSASSDPDGTIVSYAWDFGDGNVATGPTPATHTYAVAGTYTVALTVTDDVGATDTVTNEVTVSAANVSPTAEFSWESTDLDVDFDGSASSDPDGTIVSYAWDFGDGNVATGPTPATHTYAVAGTYTVALTVTDDVGATDTVTNEVTVSAANVSPTAEFSWESTDLDVDFDGSASLDPDGTIVSYAWDFGDGNVATGPTPATHTYAVAGTYTVALTVTDDVGATDTVTNEVTVSAANVRRRLSSRGSRRVSMWTLMGRLRWIRMGRSCRMRGTLVMAMSPRGRRRRRTPMRRLGRTRLR